MYQIANTHKCKGLALTITGKTREALSEFLTAIDYYKRLKRNRETIECILQVVKCSDNEILYRIDHLVFLALKLSLASTVVG